MTRQIVRALRARVTPPPFAVHFHADGPDGTIACFDASCGRAPLSTD